MRERDKEKSKKGSERFLLTKFASPSVSLFILFCSLYTRKVSIMYTEIYLL